MLCVQKDCSTVRWFYLELVLQRDCSTERFSTHKLFNKEIVEQSLVPSLTWSSSVEQALCKKFSETIYLEQSLYTIISLSTNLYFVPSLWQCNLGLQQSLEQSRSRTISPRPVPGTPRTLWAGSCSFVLYLTSTDGLYFVLSTPCPYNFILFLLM